MKKTALFLGLWIGCVTSAHASDCVVDGLCYEFKDGYAVVVASGFENSSVTIPSEISYKKYIGWDYDETGKPVDIYESVTYRVRGIGYEAFYRHTEITHVSIPDGMEWIDGRAFYGCNLTDITIPESVTYVSHDAFEYCRNLKTILCKSSDTRIDYSAFWDCDNLTRVVVPPLLNGYSFRTYFVNSDQCLTSAEILDGQTDIVDYMFKGFSKLEEVKLPSSVKSIGDYAFDQCYALPDLVIPNNVTSIGKYAFQACKKLTKVELPAGVRSIPEYCFCSAGLTSLPNLSSVTNIGHNAFCGCHDIQVVSIPDNVIEIGSCVFGQACDNLTEFTLSAHIKKLCSTFSRCEFDSINIPDHVEDLEHTFLDCKNLSSVTLPSHLRTIGVLTFGGCDKLNQIDIPSLVTNIANEAFLKSGLEEIMIPNSVLNTGGNAFSQCTNLKTVCIGSGIKALTNGEFSYCPNLKTVCFPNSLEEINSSVLYACCELNKVIFNGPPPVVSAWESNSKTVFEDAGSYAIGYYSADFKSEWESVVDENGKWQGLKMEIFPSSEFKFEYDEQTGHASLKSYIGSSTTVTIPDKAYIDANGMQTDAWGGGETYQVTRISRGAFADNKTLQDLVIPDSVEQIDEGAFSGCDNLSSVSLGSGVTDIPAGAFANMTALKTVEIRGTITGYIGARAFYGCTALENLSAKDRIKPSTIFMQAFYGVPASFMINLSQCTFIGPEAFCGCSGFCGSGNAATLSLPAAEEICESAFEGCTSIAAVEFGMNLAVLGSSAFKDSGAKVISFAGCPPTSIGEFPFDGVPKGAEGYAQQDISEWWKVIDSATGMWCGLYFPGFINHYTTLVYNYEAIHDDGTFDENRVSAILLKRTTSASGVVSMVQVGKYKIDGITKECHIQEMNNGEYVVTFAYDDDSWVCSGPTSETVVFPLGEERRQIVYFRKKPAATDFVLTVQLYDEDHDKSPYRVQSYGSECDILRRVEIPMYTLPFPNVVQKSTWWPDYGEFVLQWHYYKDKKIGEAITASSLYVGSTDARLRNNELMLYAQWDWKWHGEALTKAQWQYSKSTYEENATLQSGKVEDGEKSAFALTSSCAMNRTFEFKWATSCESAFELSDGTTMLRDHAAFIVDGEVVATRDGVSPWETVTVELAGGIAHTLMWCYLKDESGSAGEDCVWVSGLHFNADENAKADGSYTETIGEYSWYYDVDNGEATIMPMYQRDGAMRAISPSPDGVLNIPLSLGGCPVVGIGEGAFECCTGLTSVIILDGVASIGSQAFSGCSGISSVMIPPGVTNIGDCAFDGCSALTKVVIPDGVTYIGYCTFRGCDGLADVTIPASVTSIDNHAFEGCDGLTSVTVPGWQCKLNFSNVTNLVISDGTTCISNDAFAVCGELVSVTMPSSVKSIGDSAFHGCGGLTSATIPSGVTNVGEYAFYDCIGLTDVTIPSGVVSVGRDAFCFCSELTNVTIEAGVKNIGNAAFYGCSKLPNLAIPQSVTNIGEYAFCGCSGLEWVTIPANVSRVGAHAFEGCAGLASVTVPGWTCSIDFSTVTNLVISDGTTSIGFRAFYDCGSLTSVTIPPSVTNMDDSAFAYCSALTSVTIADGATYIGDHAFQDCSGLSDVTIPSSVTNIGGSAFDDCGARLNFKGLPPIVSGYRVSNDCTGYFAPEYADDWMSVIENGYWYGIEMHCEKEYTVHFDANGGNEFGGENMPDRVVPQNYTFNLPMNTFTRDGYTFDGWAYSADSAAAEIADGEAVKDLTSADEITLYAHWTKDQDGPYSETIGGYTWYYEIADGEATIVAPDWWGHLAVENDLVVPDELGGCPVVAIDDYALSSSYLQCGLVIPDSVETIGEYAFWGAITNLSIGSGVDTIAESAFCSASVEKIALDPDNENFELRQGVLYTADRTTLLLAESGITELVLPAEMTNALGPLSFISCSSLASIAVEDGNSRYEARNGLLFDTGNASIICAPRRSGTSTCSVPEGAEVIRAYAFYGSDYRAVQLPEGLLAIESQAFYNSTNLSVVALPTSLEYVGYSAFENTALWNDALDAAEANSVTTPIIHDGWLLGCYYEDDFSGKIVLPDGVRSLAAYSLYDGSVVDITLPDSVDRINGDAFYSYGLTKIRFKGHAPSRIGASCQDGVLTYRYDSLAGYDSTAVCYVRADATGWTDGEGVLPEYWPLDPADPENTNSAFAMRYWTTGEPTMTIARDVGGGNCQVTLTDETDGATIRYTTDGSEPNESSAVYEGPIPICDDTVVRAYATSDDLPDSDIVSWQVSSQSDLPLYWPTATNDQESPWFEACSPFAGTMQSGHLNNYGTSAFEIVTNGAFEISFSWMTASANGCENLVFYVDEQEVAQLYSDQDWENVNWSVEGNGEHVLRWCYENYGWLNCGSDCGRVSNVTITVTVPYDPIPDIGSSPTQDEVHDALEGSADMKLVECITNAASYTAYRNWAETVKGTNGTQMAGAHAVRNSPTAWVSFALGSEKLLENAPTDEDLDVEKFEPSSEAGKFDFTVSIDGVAVGDDALKENLKQVFGLEGSSTLNSKDFTSDNVDIDFGMPQGGKVKFTAGPKDTNAGTFFMKVKVK